jgi:predicted ArsR family transcriptional regulator
LHALADVGVVTLERTRGTSGRPATIVRITDDGRTRFLSYIDELESVVRAVQERAQPSVAPRLAQQA